MNIEKIILQGLLYAQNDYVKISETDNYDVKPKEDQIKCTLYRAFTEQRFLVKVESRYPNSKARCDLVIVDVEKKTQLAIEIKTAWAGNGWVNKPLEQANSWLNDILKLKTLIPSSSVTSGYFILCFAYEDNSKHKEELSYEIKKLNGILTEPVSIIDWNGLNRVQFCMVKVF